MSERRIAALACAFFLMASVPALAQSEDFGTYSLPEDMTVCEPADIRYYDVPQELDAMYGLMEATDFGTDVYLFLTPNKLGVVSVARRDVRGGGTVQTLMDAWPHIEQALAREKNTVAVEDARITQTILFGYEAVRVNAALTLSGETPMTVSLEGTAFFRDDDILEIWTVFPDEAFCTQNGFPAEQRTADRAAAERLLTSFDFGGSLTNSAANIPWKGDTVVYQDPGGAFEVTVPRTARVITPQTEQETVAACRELYAVNSPAEGRLFDMWHQDVLDSGGTLMLLPEAGLAWQIFCEDNEDFRSATPASYARLAEPTRQWLESKCGSAQLLNNEDTVVVSGLTHAKIVFWLRDGQTDTALELYAATDSDGFLRELDIFTLMDYNMEEDQREALRQMIRTTLTYTAPVLTPGTSDAPAPD